MKSLKRITAALTLLAMLGTNSIQAEECCPYPYPDTYAYDMGGCGYDECRQAPCLSPAIALGAIALVAIIAVAVQNSSHHGHCHSHN